MKSYLAALILLINVLVSSHAHANDVEGGHPFLPLAPRNAPTDVSASGRIIHLSAGLLNRMDAGAAVV